MIDTIELELDNWEGELAVRALHSGPPSPKGLFQAQWLLSRTLQREGELAVRAFHTGPPSPKGLFQAQWLLSVLL